jgi:hypothetical protein
MEEKKERLYYPVFNKKGKASYYLDGDKIHIYSWDGKAVAFVEKDAVFTFKKKHLGWLDQGWLRDPSGKCVGFTEPGRGGPNLPKARPPADPPAEKKEAPETPEIKQSPGRPIRRPLWSDMSEQDFFAPRAKPVIKLPRKKKAEKKPAKKKPAKKKEVKKKAAGKKSGKKK